MKKYLIYLTMLLAITPAFADTYFAPQWNEFCPSQYANLDPEKDYILAEKKYWQQRKKDFDNKLNQCDSLISEEREACYNNLRLIENNATATHLAEVRIKQQDWANATNTMNAVNYHMNTTNNLINNPYNLYRY